MESDFILQDDLRTSWREVRFSWRSEINCWGAFFTAFLC